MMKDFGLVAVTGFGLIVAVFVAAGLVHKEVEKRTVFVLFSKPVSRAAFIAGKFLGLCGDDGGGAGRDGRSSCSCWCGSVAGEASGMVLLAVAHDLRAAARRHGRDHLLLDARARRSSPACSASACSSPASSATTCCQLTRLGKNPVTEALSWVVYVIIPNLSAVDVKAGVVGEQTLAWGADRALGGVPARLHGRRAGARHAWSSAARSSERAAGGSSSSLVVLALRRRRRRLPGDAPGEGVRQPARLRAVADASSWTSRPASARPSPTPTTSTWCSTTASTCKATDASIRCRRWSIW